MKFTTLLVVVLLAIVLLVSSITASQVNEQLNDQEKGEVLRMCLFDCFSKANDAVHCPKSLPLDQRKICSKAKRVAVEQAETSCALKCGVSIEKLD